MRSAGVVSLAVLASRVTGLCREMAMTRLFGAGASLDAFLLGFRIPNLTRDLFAEGAFQRVRPLPSPITSHTAARKRPRVWRTWSRRPSSSSSERCAALGMIFAPQLVELLGSGFHNVPGSLSWRCA